MRKEALWYPFHHLLSRKQSPAQFTTNCHKASKGPFHAVAMPSSPDPSGPCSCCPYPGSASHTPDDAENGLVVGAEVDLADAGAVASPEENLQRLCQLADSKARQNASPGQAATTENWGPTHTNEPPLAADTMMPYQDYWPKLQAAGDDRPPKRLRRDFEADAAATHGPSTCFEALRRELMQPMLLHFGRATGFKPATRFELNWTVEYGDGDSTHGRIRF